MKKQHWKLINILFGTLFLLFIFNVPAFAANPQKVTLKPGKTYTKYDITGNGKADRIYMKQSDYDYASYNKFTIQVNNKTVYTSKEEYFPDAKVKLYTLKNKKPYLYIYLSKENDYGAVCGMFRYKSGKLKKVYDFQSLPRVYGNNHYGEVVSVKGNTFCFKQQLMLISTGVTNLYWNYTYKGNEIRRSSAVCTNFKIYTYKGFKKSLYTNKSIQGYTSVATSKKSIKIPKNKKVIFKGYYFKNRKLRIKVSYKGKNMWIIPGTDYWKQQFKNVVYAG